MANDFSPENIYNFRAYIQCKLALVGADIANQLSYEDICVGDKLNFILAHIYKNIIGKYNANSCISEEDLCTMINFVNKYIKETSYHNNNCNCK